MITPVAAPPYAIASFLSPGKRPNVNAIGGHDASDGISAASPALKVRRVVEPVGQTRLGGREHA